MPPACTKRTKLHRVCKNQEMIQAFCGSYLLLGRHSFKEFWWKARPDLRKGCHRIWYEVYSWFDQIPGISADMMKTVSLHHVNRITRKGGRSIGEPEKFVQFWKAITKCNTGISVFGEDTKEPLHLANSRFCIRPESTDSKARRSGRKLDWKPLNPWFALFQLNM